jgi:thiamine biosynthesis lipoprotein
VNRLESWLLHISTFLLAATGLIYPWMHYLMKPTDPFSVVNHPLEPYVFKAHILIAPLLVLGFGMILHSHILFKIGTGTRIARRSGLILIPVFVVMVISGYLLQIIISDFRKVLVWIHLISGVIWSLIYLGHQVASYWMRQKQNGNRFRLPVQIAILPLLILLGSASCIAQPLVREVYCMGTTLRIVTFEPDQDRALEQSEILIRKIEEADEQLSTWKANSELSSLNREPVGSAFHTSFELIQLLRKLQQWTSRTNGAFDPGIGRLIDTWGVHTSFRIPNASEIHDALAAGGLNQLILNEKQNTVIKKTEIRIDPGAFGKGEALDRAIRVAAEKKMAPVLLDFGGQIAVFGEPPDGSGWSTKIADPERRSATKSRELILKSGSLSTSGFSERSGKVAGELVNHILNPQTGHPAEFVGSVTVWAEEALSADVLSTALYVMGPKKGLEWAETNHVAAEFISSNDRLQSTSFVEKFKRK